MNPDDDRQTENRPEADHREDTGSETFSVSESLSTYRRGTHTTSDDPSRYRDEENLPEWRTADPIERSEGYLREHGVVDTEFVEEVERDTKEELAGAVEAAESGPKAHPTDVFDPVFEEISPRLVKQREWLLAFLEDHDLRRGH